MKRDSSSLTTLGTPSPKRRKISVPLNSILRVGGSQTHKQQIGDENDMNREGNGDKDTSVAQHQARNVQFNLNRNCIHTYIKSLPLLTQDSFCSCCYELITNDVMAGKVGAGLGSMGDDDDDDEDDAELDAMEEQVMQDIEARLDQLQREQQEASKDPLLDNKSTNSSVTYVVAGEGNHTATAQNDPANTQDSKSDHAASNQSTPSPPPTEMQDDLQGSSESEDILPSVPPFPQDTATDNQNVAVECSSCAFYYHSKCAGLSFFEALILPVWVCGACKNTLKEVQVNALKDCIDYIADLDEEEQYHEQIEELFSSLENWIGKTVHQFFQSAAKTFKALDNRLLDQLEHLISNSRQLTIVHQKEADEQLLEFKERHPTEFERILKHLVEIQRKREEGQSAEAEGTAAPEDNQTTNNENEMAATKETPLSTSTASS
uniref:Uncharacterized protein n=1 Tax=Percolomonas cosmopolitus TaxID=63605 RepID=A0A7S1PGH9_9EUKA|mmetsp:Transcript_3493/g.13338  ORF Transcript_3493/g.13338 Transcript_3493/m.13338 type:complete len:434 (+) Transcript_3493:89-1390(+)